MCCCSWWWWCGLGVGRITCSACPCKRALLIKISAWGKTLFLTAKPTFWMDFLSTIIVQQSSNARAVICKSMSLPQLEISRCQLSWQSICRLMKKARKTNLMRVESSAIIVSYEEEPIWPPYVTTNEFSVPNVACLRALLACYIRTKIKKALSCSSLS